MISKTRFLGLERRHLLNIGLFLLVALGFLFRLAPLGRYVTPDEPAWVERSVRFTNALKARDWASIPSTGHPGVTTMWLGAVGVTVRKWLHPIESAHHLGWIRRLAWLAPENGRAFPHLAFFLAPGRVGVAFVNGVGLVAIYCLVKRLFNHSTAFLAVGLLAFDPFVVGLSGLLHTDGLLATFCMLSVLSLLMALEGNPRSGTWALVSGATGGLALLTKSLGAYLAIFTGVVLISAWLSGRIRFSRMVTWLFLWGLSLVLIYVALYPALWGSPLETVRDLVAAPFRESTTALMPTFFAGEMGVQHGPQFYAVALPFRLNPLVLIGLLWGGWVLLKGEPWPQGLVWLALFSLGYILLLAPNVKRYQRYLLPAVQPLTVIAASFLSDGQRARLGSPALRPFFIILLQLLLLLPFAAYPLTGLNPLLGGPWTGKRLLSTDWGEGMGAAARWLNQRPDARSLTVAASSVPSFGTVFVGRTVPLEHAAKADYVVRDVPQVPRPRFDLPVAYTASLRGLSHAVVLTNTAPLRQADYLADHAAPDDLILLDADTPLLRRYEGPGTLLSVASLPDEEAMAHYLKQKLGDGGSVWRVASPAGSPITAAHLERRLGDVGEPITTTTVADGSVTRYVVETEEATQPVSSHRAIYGGRLALIDGLSPTSVTRSDDLRVVLRWQAVSELEGDLRAVVTLRDGSGHAWTSVGSLIRNDVDFPTSTWPVGEWTDFSYKINLPPGIPPGPYVVEVRVYDDVSGAGLGATDGSGAFAGTRVPLGEVDVTRHAHASDGPEIDVSRSLAVAAGPLTLTGFDPPADEVLSGDMLEFSLVWRAEMAVKSDYDVRFQLIDSAGQVVHEVVRPLSPYPLSRWEIGDRFRSYYRFQVPAELSPAAYQLTLNVIGKEDPGLWKRAQTLGMVHVAAQERTFALPQQPAQELDLTFGETIHLVGYDLRKSETSPGEDVGLTLYWRADGPTEHPYTLFVHLRGPNGELRGQVDRTPGGGTAPTNRWAAGQVIVDEVALPVAGHAQPGSHRIVIGFYDPAYGGRLPVTDSSGILLGDDEAVLPTQIAVSGGPSD